jgi:hypothetical protein
MYVSSKGGKLGAPTPSGIGLEKIVSRLPLMRYLISEWGSLTLHLVRGEAHEESSLFLVLQVHVKDKPGGKKKQPHVSKT